MKNTDETAIEGLVHAFVDGWNKEDGNVYAQPSAQQNVLILKDSSQA